MTPPPSSLRASRLLRRWLVVLVGAVTVIGHIAAIFLFMIVLMRLLAGESWRLTLAVAAGAVFGAVKLFDDPERSVSTLNRFCLYLAFPALIFANVATAELSLADAPGFVVAINQSV